MKVIVGDNKAYLQKIDLAFMIDELSAVPSCIMLEAFSSARMVSVCGGDDAASFGFCFESKEAVEFIKKCDWILDFSEYSQKDIDKLIALYDKMASELRREIDDFNTADLDYRKKHFGECSEKFDHMKMQAMNLEMLIGCKKGKIKMPVMPTEETVLENNGFFEIGRNGTPSIHIEVVDTSKKKRGLFSRLFKRSAQ